jgi:hypothetical protein
VRSGQGCVDLIRAHFPGAANSTRATERGEQAEPSLTLVWRWRAQFSSDNINGQNVRCGVRQQRTKGWWSRLQGRPQWLERQNRNGHKRG